MKHSIKKPIIIIGAGGHARVLIEAIRLMKLEIIGATDANPKSVEQSKLGVKLLGNDEKILKYAPNEILLVNGVGQVKVSPVRAKIFELYKSKGYQFATVRHPSAVLTSDVKIGEGSQVMAGVVIQPGTVIGQNSILNTRVSIDHDCQIGSHVHIAPGTTVCGTVTVGDGCHVGIGVILVNNITIKSNSFIKSGTLVIQNLEG